MSRACISFHPIPLPLAALFVRPQYETQFVSTEHTRSKLGSLGPDPGTYKLPAALGSQLLSNKRNTPAFSWGKTDRLRDEFEKSKQVRGWRFRGGTRHLVVRERDH